MAGGIPPHRFRADGDVPQTQLSILKTRKSKHPPFLPAVCVTLCSPECLERQPWRSLFPETPGSLQCLQSPVSSPESTLHMRTLNAQPSLPTKAKLLVGFHLFGVELQMPKGFESEHPAAKGCPEGPRCQWCRCLCLTMSDSSALKFWMASSRLCCSRSRSISLVCSERAFCTSRSRSRRLASMRACRSSSFSFSESKFWNSATNFSQ